MNKSRQKTKRKWKDPSLGEGYIPPSTKFGKIDKSHYSGTPMQSKQITRRVARPANCDESPTGSYKQTPTAQ